MYRTTDFFYPTERQDKNNASPFGGGRWFAFHLSRQDNTTGIDSDGKWDIGRIGSLE
jgi:hypothetical protein